MPAAFVRWFDGTRQYELIEAEVGDVGPRLQLRWRARLQASWLDPGWFVVEQTAYADTDDEDRIWHLSGAVLGLPRRAARWLSRPRSGVDGNPPSATTPSPTSRRCAARPVQPVRLADGHDAWVVLGHDAARQALNDGRISKDMVAALEGDPDVVAGGLPGPDFSRHMLNVDPPDHTRLRRLVAKAFLPSRVVALEPAIQAVADDLLDDLEAEGPEAVVDLVERFAHPLPFRVDP